MNSKDGSTIGVENNEVNFIFKQFRETVMKREILNFPNTSQ